MANFKLTVVTPDRIFYDGEATFIMLRTITGDIGIMSNHTRYVSSLVIGTLKVKTEDKTRLAAIAGGFIKVGDNKVTIVTPACEWQDEIDIERAKRAANKAKENMDREHSKRAYNAEEVKLKTALNRIHVAGGKL